MEHWIEINLSVKEELQNEVLLDVLRPFVTRLEKKKELLTWHYFREPEIRFRVRFGGKVAKEKQVQALSRLADALVGRGLVSEWHFGNHGERGEEYTGEEDRYGKNGWRTAQEYFRTGCDTALTLLDLKRRSRLESPLWARGLGNPWEGGDRNPWREWEEDPLVYHWSRLVHLFSNQLGFDMEKEAELCAKQSERYGRVVKELGLKW